MSGKTSLTPRLVGALYVGLFVVEAVGSYRAPLYRFHGSGVVFLISLLGVMVTLLWRGREVRRWDWALPGVLVAFALLSYPGTSRDFLRYLFDGEMIRLWHLSPYVHLPGDFPPDQYSRLFDGIWWTKIPSPYGPLWQALMVMINFVTDNRLVGGIIALKLVNLAGLLACARYIYLITRQSWASFLFLINPVILLNTVATPHADIVIAAGLLAAYYYRGAPARGGLIAAGALVKAHTLIFLPLLNRRRQDIWRSGLWAVVSLAGLLLVLKPFVGFDWLAMLQAGQGGGVSGTQSLLMRSLMPWAPAQTVFLASYGLFAAAYAGILAAFWRRRLRALDALILASLLVPFCLTGLLLPWHFIMPMALLVLSSRRVAAWAVLLFTLLVLRSTITVAELIIMAALFGGGGWLVHRLYMNMAKPPRYLARIVGLFE